MSFRLKTVIGIATIEIVLLVFLVYSSVLTLKESHLASLSDRAVSTANTFAITVKDAVISSDLATLEEFVTDLSQHKGIAYVKVLNDKQEVLSQSGAPDILPRQFVDDEAEPENADDGTFDVGVDITEGGALFGRVELGLSTEAMQGVIADATTQLSGIATIEVALSALFSLMLGAYLTRQLSLLNHGAKALADGDIGYEIPVMGKDEIARTAQAFNDMSRKLQHQYHDLHMSQTRLKAIFDSVVDGIVTINREGIIQSVNPATERLFGYQESELIGNNVSILTPSPHREHHDEYIRNYIRTGEAKVIGHPREVEGLHKDGSLIPIELIMNELNIDDELFFLGVTRDISERKQVEQMKDGFVATISHELRTPLTVILGYLPFLTDAEKLPPPAMVAQMATKIESSGKHLLQLVNELLDISKIEAGRMVLDCADIELADEVYGAVDDMRPMARKKGLAIETDVPDGMVYADSMRLRQVLINLIGNAVKFTAEGRINVSARFDPEHREAVISVSDTGQGISEADQANVFDRFKQADNKLSRQAGGTGLGLAISKSLIELHGGRMSLKSIEGEGSTFTFTVPLAGSEGDNGATDSDS